MNKLDQTSDSIVHSSSVFIDCWNTQTIVEFLQNKVKNSKDTRFITRVQKQINKFQDLIKKEINKCL